MADRAVRAPPLEGLALRDATLLSCGSYIAGEFRGIGARKVVVTNPANDGIVSTVASATNADIDRCVPRAPRRPRARAACSVSQLGRPGLLPPLFPSHSAVQSCADAYGDWRAVPPRERGEVLLRWAALVEEARDDLSRIITLENGTGADLYLPLLQAVHCGRALCESGFAVSRATLPLLTRCASVIPTFHRYVPAVCYLAADENDRTLVAA